MSEELQSRWLVWREELIAGGVTSLPQLRVQLETCKNVWLTTRDPESGKTPMEVVLREKEVGRWEPPEESHLVRTGIRRNPTRSSARVFYPGFTEHLRPEVSAQLGGSPQIHPSPPQEP